MMPVKSKIKLKQFIALITDIYRFKPESIREVLSSTYSLSISGIIFVGIALLNSVATVLIYDLFRKVTYDNVVIFKAIQTSLPNASSLDVSINLFILVFIFTLVPPLGVSIISVWIANYFKKNLTYIGFIQVASIVYLVQILLIIVNFSGEYSGLYVFQIINLLIGLWLFINFIVVYKIATGFSFLKSIGILFISFFASMVTYTLLQYSILLIFKVFFSIM